MDQELEMGQEKGKGPELAPEVAAGQESWKCNSCE